MDEFERLFAQTRPAFKQDRSFQMARELSSNALLALGKHTITGMLSAGGRQFQDWSAAYRLFENERFEQKGVFAPIINNVGCSLDAESPLYAMMDDTDTQKERRR